MYTIDDFKKGMCAVRTDGTLDQIIKVIGTVCGDYRNYYVYKKGWMCGYDAVSGIPVQSVKDFTVNKKHKSNIHTDIQSLKDKYPQFNITVSVEEKV